MFKKINILFLCALLALCTGVACAKENPEKLIVCSSFPYYDFTLNILGERKENFNVELLQDSGMDLHSFKPSAADFVKLSSADLFIYNGGPSEIWADKAAKEAKNQNMAAVNLLESLGSAVKEEKIVEGMEEHDHGDEHDHEEHDREDDHEEHEHADEHIWLSLKNAKLIVSVIAKNIAEIDPENKEVYKNNLKIYIEKLDELDKKYEEAVRNACFDTLLFGGRFPFRYLMDDYNIKYFAAFEGCSAESEASFETVAFLANKLNELNLNTVLVLDGSNDDLAKAIISASQRTDINILMMDSMQTIDRKRIENGANYLNIMEQNLLTLKQALGGEEK